MHMLENMVQKVNSGNRIDAADALALLNHSETLDLAEMATRMRKKLHPEPIVTYVVDRNINYTNICRSGCLFCAFYHDPDTDGGYVISEKDLAAKIHETISLGGTQILLQGGLNPRIHLNDYLKLLCFIKNNFDIHIHGFSPPEILFMAEQSSLSISETITKLMEAGLGSIPGGGAEILVDEVRNRISPNKCSSGEWLEVMRTAHLLGLKTTATMMFGHIETKEHIVRHLLMVRDLQDETGGFTAFIPWTFQPGNTRLNVKKATAVEYLRVLAVSRLLLDNISNIQASWVTQGEKIAQTALVFGANDFGSTMIEENVVRSAGVSNRTNAGELIKLAHNAGFDAAQRDTAYNIIKIHNKRS